MMWRRSGHVQGLVSLWQFWRKQMSTLLSSGMMMAEVAILRS